MGMTLQEQLMLQQSMILQQMLQYNASLAGGFPPNAGLYQQAASGGAVQPQQTLVAQPASQGFVAQPASQGFVAQPASQGFVAQPASQGFVQVGQEVGATGGGFEVGRTERGSEVHHPVDGDDDDQRSGMDMGRDNGEGTLKKKNVDKIFSKYYGKSCGLTRDVWYLN